MIRVNGEPVDEHHINEAFSRIKGDAERKYQVSCCERDPIFRAEAEEEVIDSILISQDSDHRVTDPPEEKVRERLKEIIELYREQGASWDMLEKQSPAIREECAANLRMEMFMDAVMADVPELTEESFVQYYENHKDEYRAPARARCLHLMKKLEPDEGPVPPQELFETMVALREELLGGADFLEVAKRETQKHDEVIDLDWMEHEYSNNPFDSVLFSLHKDEISPVLTYQHALHLIKVIDTEPPTAPPYEEIAEKIREHAQLDRRRTALKNLATKLRETATIERIEEEEAD